ncbi:MAG TPA: hypothetical protein DD723_07100 [Candidatus Omnitrophica bacterium]|nr:MAG: hypothetical protein A2Z81_05860 [Omnitrophica WOR_2 bacterium GWA2_45_18]HBR15292.1 hypothetical protein [Candidatus Omnitrophota bacterium]
MKKQLFFLRWVAIGCAGIFILLATSIIVHKDGIKKRLRNNFLISHILKERERVKYKAKLKILNLWMPEINNSDDSLTARQRIDQLNGMEYLEYYRKVVEFMPWLAEAHALLGFWQYRQGQGEEAISSYQKAIYLGPNIFWFQYNLGGIYFRGGQYEKAIELLRGAVATHPTETLKLTVSSKIYQQMLSVTKGDALEEGLKDGYHDARILLILSHYYTKRFSPMLFYAIEGMKLEADEGDDFYFYAGLACYELKEFAKAAFFLQEGVKRNQNDADATHYWGLSLQALGHEGVSEKILQRAAILYSQQGTSFMQDNAFQPRIF